MPTSNEDHHDALTGDQGRIDSVGGHPWKRRNRPLRLERRLEFADYDTLRAFLDRAGALSERTSIYPNLSFGRTYANLTLFADDDTGELSPDAERFAQQIDGMLKPLEDTDQ